MPILIYRRSNLAINGNQSEFDYTADYKLGLDLDSVKSTDIGLGAQALLAESGCSTSEVLGDVRPRNNNPPSDSMSTCCPNDVSSTGLCLHQHTSKQVICVCNAMDLPMLSPRGGGLVLRLLCVCGSGPRRCKQI